MGRALNAPAGAEDAADRWRAGLVAEGEGPTPALVAGWVLAQGGQLAAATRIGVAPSSLRGWVSGRTVTPLPYWLAMLWASRSG